jgi:catechol 2,3-dioxygenase-like lactoylglutathione lyase family enzyme
MPNDKRLLDAGLKPFSLDADCAIDPIGLATDPLTFGSRSVYVEDPDANLFEFVEVGVSLEMADLKP